MQTVAQLLKEARSKRNITIEQVAESTKIRTYFLESLERGDYGAFASEVYAKGFLKNYAKYLGLNKEKIMALYRREREVREEQNLQNVNGKVKQSRINITPTAIIIFIVSIAVISVLAYIGLQIEKILQPPMLKLSEPIAVAAGEEKNINVEVDAITLEGKIEAGAELYINGKKLDTGNFTDFSTPYSLEEGTNPIEIRAVNQFSKESIIKLLVFAEFKEDEEAPPSSEEQPPPEEQPEPEMVVELEVVNGETWLMVKADEQQVLAGIIQPGTKNQFKAKTEVTVNTGNSANTILKINDQVMAWDIASGQKTWFLENGQVIEKTPQTQGVTDIETEPQQDENGGPNTNTTN